jgi:hypothetical protein
LIANELWKAATCIAGALVSPADTVAENFPARLVAAIID